MSKTNKIYAISGAAVVILIMLLTAGQIWKGKSGSDINGPTYKVKRGPLSISFVVSGTVRAREQAVIKSEVEGRTTIIYVIPEGTRVKKGDLLIELDASTLTDQKIDQEISVQNAEASYISAKENQAVVENQAKSDIDLAKLTLDFAKQDLEKYLSGEYPYQLDKSEADIKLAEEELTRANETLKWSQKLYEEKYISQTELQADELAAKKKELDLELAKKSKDLLADYTYKRNLAQLKSDVSQAEMAMERTERKANASVIQAKAELKARESEFQRQKDKLQKMEDQLAKTRIYAPTDGQVIHATSTRGGHDPVEPLDVGREVQEREELIYLPAGYSSKADVMVHESNLKKISKGLPAIITVDALLGKTLYGTIATIAPLPDPRSMWINPDLKVYSTEIYIDGNDTSLRTGMSCQAEIIVQQYKDAIYVPMQAVTRINNDPTVYVWNGSLFQSRTVELGLDNSKVIHILNGLKEGEIVLLTPPLKSSATEAQAQSLSEKSSDGLQEKISQNLRDAENQLSEDSNQTSETQPAAPKRARGQFKNASPEQREAMRKKFEQMSPEEKEKLRQEHSISQQEGPAK
ncbi:MAG: efflux transporter periplasmic adaptor subunit [Phycisphaerae bacterium]|nr:efflux transporter periplasmic adaptor subunit [Phycisphaerae bacterium]